MDHAEVWLAVGFHCDRIARCSVVDFLARHVSRSTTASQAQFVCAGLHSKRSARSGGGDSVVASDSLSADMGIWARQVHDRSELVVLSFLAAEIPDHAVA